MSKSVRDPIQSSTRSQSIASAALVPHPFPTRLVPHPFPTRLVPLPFPTQLTSSYSPHRPVHLPPLLQRGAGMSAAEGSSSRRTGSRLAGLLRRASSGCAWPVWAQAWSRRTGAASGARAQWRPARRASAVAAHGRRGAGMAYPPPLRCLPSSSLLGAASAAAGSPPPRCLPSSSSPLSVDGHGRSGAARRRGRAEQRGRTERRTWPARRRWIRIRS
ncbi:hypothetical protein PVAP13_2KG411686 [Panicum virgatum]|uniref:Uncharacterized protein n=1 Tax=Panicum virgatum TaxID=38727 RepID=A0A8T0WGI7_PANVG|nr:hypothetical protein PVAP13_2KG411686 [Panicum virgatum]